MRRRLKAATAEISVTASVGVVAIAPREPTSPESLIELADRAMYDAKRRGRDQVIIGDSPDA